MKIFGVKGEKIWGEDKETQDFTFNNYPVLELRVSGVPRDPLVTKTNDWVQDPKTTYDIADSLERNWDDLPTFADEQSKRVDADVATLGSQLPRQHRTRSPPPPSLPSLTPRPAVVAMPEYSQSAYRFGDYVAKLGVFPLGQAQKDIAHETISEKDPINVLSQHARAFHLKHKVTYSFCAQLLQSLAEQPVDDIGVEWDAAKYPFEEVATLEFAPQDSWLPQFRVWWDDRITCNSWHGLQVHRPLGSTNRMRRVVYAESRKLRLAVNGYKGYVEPASLEEVPVPVPAPQLEMPFQNAATTVEVSS